MAISKPPTKFREFWILGGIEGEKGERENERWPVYTKSSAIFLDSRHPLSGSKLVVAVETIVV